METESRAAGRDLASQSRSALWGWFSILARFLVGGTFVVAASMKLVAPVENFEAAINGFHLLPVVLDRPVALVLPWIELFAGAFCLLGLYTRLSAVIIAAMLAAFIVGLSWAKWKGFDLQNCGCFGHWDFIRSPTLLLARDAVLLLLTLPMLPRQRFRFSLEEYARRKAGRGPG